MPKSLNPSHPEYGRATYWGQRMGQATHADKKNLQGETPERLRDGLAWKPFSARNQIRLQSSGWGYGLRVAHKPYARGVTATVRADASFSVEWRGVTMSEGIMPLVWQALYQADALALGLLTTPLPDGPGMPLRDAYEAARSKARHMIGRSGQIVLRKLPGEPNFKPIEPLTGGAFDLSSLL
jgi:hypothetical protein